MNQIVSLRFSKFNWGFVGILFGMLGVQACSSRNLYREFPTVSQQSEPILRREWTYALKPASSKLVQPGVEYSNVVAHQNVLAYGSARFGVTALYPKYFREKWTIPLKQGMVSPLQIEEGNLYFTSGEGELTKVELESGRSIWTTSLRNPVTSRVTFYEGKLYVVTSEDMIIRIDAESGKPEWHYRRRNVSGPTIHGASKPLIVEDSLWVGFADGALVSLTQKEGRVVWEKQLNSQRRFSSLNAEMLKVGDSVFLPAYDSALFRLNAKSGNSEWVKEGLGSSRSVSWDGDDLFVPSSKGFVYRLNAKDGAELWKFELDGGIPSRVLVLGKVVVFSSSDQYFYALDRETGKLLDRVSAGYGSGFAGDPIMDPESPMRVLSLTHGGNLWAIRVHSPEKKK